MRSLILIKSCKTVEARVVSAVKRALRALVSKRRRRTHALPTYEAGPSPRGKFIRVCSAL